MNDTYLRSDRPIFSQFLRNSSNSINMNVNGSVTPVSFKFGADDRGQPVYLAGMAITIKDTANLDSDKYGNNIELTNGVEIYLVRDRGGTYEVTRDKHIKTNGDWITYTHDVTLLAFGSGSEYLSIRWDFKTIYGDYIRLDLGDYLEIRIKDDLTGLEEHTCIVKGLL